MRDGQTPSPIDSAIRMLPPAASLSPSVISFLNAKLSTVEDLERAPDLLSELRNQCDDLDRSLSDLNKQLETYLFDYSSQSGQINGILDDINHRLKDLQSSSSRTATSSSDGDPGKIWGEELPALAKEVARVETVQKYAKTALKLDTLVGEIEDAVSATVKRTLKRHPSSKSSEDMQAVAITSLKLTEDTLRLISKTHPRWQKLVAAVDHRVDRALAMLRPQAIADHRSLLASLGWPPPLSTLKSSGQETKKSITVHNPLLTMQGELKGKYCESFLTLCSLQELQRQRKSRQLEGTGKHVAIHQSLWTIEELVNPISVACQKHFSKWTDQPELIFALVYKVTQDYVDSMDELLQPLVDEAMLSGYSCREEWIASMVSSLCIYLAKEVFPQYTSSLSDEDGTTGTESHGRASWLFLIDLMIGFDKKVQSLVSHSGISLSLQEDGLEKVSSLSVFNDRPDWLDLWAKIEHDDSLDKLKPDIIDERNWSNSVQGTDLLSGQGDAKSPAITSSFLRRLSAVIDRCRSLPTVPLRSRFLQLAGAPLINKFIDSILLRSQEAEGLTALTDDSALTKVARCINGSRHFETVLKEWCEDVFFLEMRFDRADQFENRTNQEEEEESPGTGIFHCEIKKLEEFRTEWAEKLSTVVLRGFDMCCRDYMKNKKQWQEREDEEGGGHVEVVSQSLVNALDYLQGKMSVLALGLNSVDFVAAWRSLASKIDALMFAGIFGGSAKFSGGRGVERLGYDLGVMFGVFRQWCFRPEGFFPKLSEALKLLKMTKKQHQICLKGGEASLKENGIRHLTLAEAEKIARNRI
ncbi:unnamed protein product [Cuscuta campestris]|uniref:RINT1-like protein MAG2 n=1 Tax=Cuscuta campestris TaxID=132261 RepID=A0A484MDZ4_9ASTE|nr:unnamed protein product [Cuscuta campestris]